MQQSLLRKEIVDKLADDFEILFSFKAMCVCFPYFSYKDDVEIRELEKEMAILDLSSIE